MELELDSRGPARSLILLVLLTSSVAAAEAPVDLPRYQMNVELDPAAALVTIQQQVTFRNTSSQPTDKIIFHVYPRAALTKEDAQKMKALPVMLRMDPRDMIDPKGRRLTVNEIRRDGVALKFEFHPKLDTIMIVPLSQALAPGQSIVLELDATLELPPIQGRWGQWDGVNYLLNWYPILAYFDEEGWHPTPFVPWHQPWYASAAQYDATLKLPEDLTVASTGEIIDRRQLGGGQAEIRIQGVGRDFAIVASNRFKQISGDADGITVRVSFLPGHEFFAKEALQIAQEVIPLYNQWFGRYPFKEFEIAESFFGWNGNESSGMVSLDHRVWNLPEMAHRLFDGLLSHEIMHQWWYNVVGTNGYAESFMDESLPSYLTNVRMRMKYPYNVALIDWPQWLRWLPNIRNEDYGNFGYYSLQASGKKMPVVQPIEKFGNPFYLFATVYGRGGRVMQMVHHRMGDERFFEFLQLIYQKYKFRSIKVKQFRTELEAFTSESWEDFFADWLYSTKSSDWAVKHVRPRHVGTHYETEITLEQRADIAEPVELAVYTPAGEKRIAIEPDQLRDGSLTVRVTTEQRPNQVIVDPDQIVLDAQPDNNRWRTIWSVSLTPLYLPISNASATNPYDRPSLIVGPFIDAHGTAGLMGGIVRSNVGHATAFIGYQPDDEEFLTGVAAELFYFPGPDFSIGFDGRHSLNTNNAEERRDIGKVYMRYYRNRGQRLAQEDPEFFEFFGRVENKFDEDDNPTPGEEEYDDSTPVGVRYVRDTRLPYWDPDEGYRLALGWEHGFTGLGADESFDRFWGEASLVQRFGREDSWLSRNRIALHGLLAIGSPDNGQHFRQGGSRQFRGFHPDDYEGSVLWIGSVEWRFPILDNIDFGVLDNTIRFNAIDGVAFYDISELSINDRTNGVEHALGLGLRVDTSLFSMLERLTLRLDVARTVSENEGAIVWFGLQQAF